jgi:lipopolysaccharide biosynthesis glycosyltransferase
MTTLAVVSSADERYLPHVGAMLESLFANHSDIKIEFYFVHSQRLNAEALQPLRRQCEKYGAEFFPVRVAAERVAELPLSDTYCEEAWYRLFLPSLLPNVERVLWLDADLLVLDSLLPIWKQDLAGKPLAAIPNALTPSQWQHPAALGMQGDRGQYFNTGVMLLNLAQMRAEQVEARFQALIAEHGDTIMFADQDVFNPAFAGNYLPLKLEWNMTTGAYFNFEEAVRVHGYDAFRDAFRRPRVVHFTRMKPWLYESCHPYKRAYLAYRRAAGWEQPEYPQKTLMGWIKRRVPVLPRLLATRAAQPKAVVLLLRVWLTWGWHLWPRWRPIKRHP